MVYVLLCSPPTFDDGWTGMRCTCQEKGIHGDCEHVAYLRTLNLPTVSEPPVSFEAVPAARRAGRKRGNFTTARGKREAERRAARQGHDR
jgi:hypothetical protein